MKMLANRPAVWSLNVVIPTTIWTRYENSVTAKKNHQYSERVALPLNVANFEKQFSTALAIFIYFSDKVVERKFSIDIAPYVK